MRSQETDALVQHDFELQNGSRISTDFQNTTPPSYFDTRSERAIQTDSPSGGHFWTQIRYFIAIRFLRLPLWQQQDSFSRIPLL